MITTDIQIRFADIDMLRHVNNIVLQNYFDLGKSYYFRDVMGLPLTSGDHTFTQASTHTDYFQEVRFDDQIAVTTRIAHVGTKSIRFVQEIVDRTTGAIKSRSESVLVAFDLSVRASIEVKPEWRARVVEHEGLL